MWDNDKSHLHFLNYHFSFKKLNQFDVDFERKIKNNRDAISNFLRYKQMINREKAKFGYGNPIKNANSLPKIIKQDISTNNNPKYFSHGGTMDGNIINLKTSVDKESKDDQFKFNFCNESHLFKCPQNFFQSCGNPNRKLKLKFRLKKKLPKLRDFSLANSYCEDSESQQKRMLGDMEISNARISKNSLPNKRYTHSLNNTRENENDVDEYISIVTESKTPNDLPFKEAYENTNKFSIKKLENKHEQEKESLNPALENIEIKEQITVTFRTTDAQDKPPLANIKPVSAGNKFKMNNNAHDKVRISPILMKRHPIFKDLFA